MSAELLKEAASLMREQAHAARASCGDNVPEWHSVRALMSDGKTREDAEHIASWPPDVALAVAGSLLVTANRVDAGRDNDGTELRQALAVARTYLGSDQ